MNYLSLTFFIFAILIGLSYCNRIVISVQSRFENGRMVYIYNGQYYNTMNDVLIQVRKDIENARRPFIIPTTTTTTTTKRFRTRATPKRPARKTPATRRPTTPVRTTKKYTPRPRPTRFVRVTTTSRKPATKIVRTTPIPPRPTPKIVTQPPVIDNRKVEKPSPKEVDDLYKFDIEKQKGNNAFSNGVFDSIWNGYDYKTDYKNGYIDMQQRFLKETNYYRQAHGVGPLQIDPYLEGLALEYAKILSTSTVIKHDPRNRQLGVGENIAILSGTLAPLAVKKWYDEVDMYDFNRNVYIPGTGHFTALVWKGTTKVGCGIVLRKGDMFIVCKYSPAGNVSPLFGDNVFPRRI